MKAKAKLKGVLTGLGSSGFISILNKTYEITFAQNPVSQYILVEIQTITRMTDNTPDEEFITSTRSVIHDSWAEFYRLWEVVEELDVRVQPEGY